MRARQISAQQGCAVPTYKQLPYPVAGYEKQEAPPVNRSDSSTRQSEHRWGGEPFLASSSLLYGVLSPEWSGLRASREELALLSLTCNRVYVFSSV